MGVVCSGSNKRKRTGMLGFYLISLHKNIFEIIIIMKKIN